MEKFVIDGGIALSGTIVPAGNKNGALPILAASVLTEEEVVVRNVPKIGDAQAMISLLEALGVRVSWLSDHEVSLCAADLTPDAVLDRGLSERIRASFLLAGPLLARFGRVRMPPPGGDVIGRRRLDPHLDAFKALGATVEHKRDIEIVAPGRPARGRRLHGRAVRHGDRERAAGRRPHARADRHRQRRLRAARPGPRADAREHGRRHRGHRLQRPDGQRRRDLHGCDHTIGPDHIEIGSFMALAGATGGELRIRDTIPADLRMIRLSSSASGCAPSSTATTCSSRATKSCGWRATPASTRSPSRTAHGRRSRPTSPRSRVALATQCDGTALIHEWMFENRMIFTDKLVLMGADITLCDPHRALVSGRSQLRGERLESPDIRAGMAMLIGALCADGRSEIGNIRQIDRGYERIDERLASWARASSASRPSPSTRKSRGRTTWAPRQGLWLGGSNLPAAAAPRSGERIRPPKLSVRHRM